VTRVPKRKIAKQALAEWRKRTAGADNGARPRTGVAQL